MPVDLIAIDLDGTLLDGKSQLSPENSQAIADASAQGIEIVLATGRRFPSARLISQDIPCIETVIASNGAVVKSISGETHLRSLLPAAAALRVLQVTAEFRSCCGLIFDRPHENQVIFERVDWEGPFIGPYLRRHREQVGESAPLEACLNSDDPANDPVEILFIGKCQMVRRAKESLEACRENCEFTLALTEYEHLGVSMLDVLRQGVSKGAALADWASRRGIARENVMAIGDNWNDREMLEYAGVPVIMGNSTPELISSGWNVTLSNNESGVAAAIRKYALNGAPHGE